MFVGSFSSTDCTMALFTSIANGTFQTMPDLDATRLLGKSFESELIWLKNATPTIESSKSPPVGSLGDNSLTPSRAVYGLDYPEINRTLVGMLAVKWLIAGDYASFTCSQNPSTKLRPESFQRLRTLLRQACPNPESVHALLVALVVNDLGKNPELASLVADPADQPLQNHDEVVYAAVKAKCFPSVETVDAARRSNLLLGIEFGAGLNIAQ